jgi:hypothetical protein
MGDRGKEWGFGVVRKVGDYIGSAKKAPIPTTMPYPTPWDSTLIPSEVAMLQNRRVVETCNFETKKQAAAGEIVLDFRGVK